MALKKRQRKSRRQEPSICETRRLIYASDEAELPTAGVVGVVDVAQETNSHWGTRNKGTGLLVQVGETERISGTLKPDGLYFAFALGGWLIRECNRTG